MVTGASDLAMVCTSDDDRLEHRTGDVLAGLGVGDHEILLVLHHSGEVCEADIASRPGVGEPPVAVPLDPDRLFDERHIGRLCPVPLRSITLFIARKPPFCRPT